jgi:hypothetical protein
MKGKGIEWRDKVLNGGIGIEWRDKVGGIKGR